MFQGAAPGNFLDDLDLAQFVEDTTVVGDVAEGVDACVLHLTGTGRAFGEDGQQRYPKGVIQSHHGSLLRRPKYAPGCATKNCAISKEWTLNADKYPAGTHNLEVIAIDGVGLATTKSIPVETHGDLLAPTVSLSGTVSEQATLGSELPAYKLKLDAIDPAGSSEERRSGVFWADVQVDGQYLDWVVNWACPNGSCSMSKEWTLPSNNYPEGPHVASVTVRDLDGNKKTASVNFQITRDKKAPTLTGNNAFYNAPEGWLEQKSYAVNATAADAGGYGITSMALKIDGQTVKSNSQSCPAGGCSLTLGASPTIDMAAYEGGAHSAELIATDGAGNTAKKSWTINVDPAGQISVAEAEDTLEAVEETAGANLLGETTTETEFEGTIEGLEFEEEEGEIFVEGNAAPTYVGADPSEGLTVEVPMEEALDACLDGGAVEQDLTGQEEEELAEDPPSECPEGSMGNSSELELLPAEVTPVSTSASSGDTTILGEDATAVATNVHPHTDLITRPLYDGAMTFAAIRDANAPRVYEWEIKLAPFQELVQVDPQHVQVRYDEDHVAFAITAVPAHDAIGTTVPTSLDIEGDVISLTIDHTSPSPAGGSFVYPVLGGSGWEGGWHSYQIAMPPNELPEEEWGEQEQEWWSAQGVRIMTMGPPEATGSTVEANPADEYVNTKRFKFTMCYPHNIPGDPFDGKLEPPFWVPHHRAGDPDSEKNLPHIVSECHREDFDGVYWAVSVTGKFHYVFHRRLRVDQSEWNCNRKWGEEEPAKVNCRSVVFEQPFGLKKWVHGPIYVLGDYRFRPMKGMPQVPETRVTCMTVGGALYPNPRKPGNDPVERPIIHEKTYPPPVEKCDWPWKDD